MTTIKDLAGIVGVSHSTVARALNDHPAITPAVKARVRAAAEAHGYIANAAARALRVQSGALVGFVVPDIEENDMAAMAKAIAECVNATGRQLVVACSGDAPERELAHVRALVGARAAALVLMPSENPLPETLALLGRLPTVQLVRRVAALAAEAFVFDDEAGIQEATAHLLALGHRRIGYVGGSETVSTGAARLAGYRRALREAGLAEDPALVSTVAPHGPAAAGAFRLLFEAARPSAIVLGGPRITLGAAEAVAELRLNVPGELSLVGFGDRAWMRWWGPGLSTVALPARELAQACGSHLVDLLRAVPRQGEAEGQAHAGALAPGLMLRGSTAPPLRGATAPPLRGATAPPPAGQAARKVPRPRPG
ncbi:LacI family DNA-binding transcriptional regulator [Falsiroseomonas tokyonensis]|uniref:LacI family DNA-binding transcriptional regulator n=1 Tax=Falsiroseomonas tokyonensis TaxID=430521 RepID=A0ABV7BWN4_9PROT|nr:LacI family DNA-binding transcriptional regulator [Falsiroseomonas tokyonensis]